MLDSEIDAPDGESRSTQRHWSNQRGWSWLTCPWVDVQSLMILDEPFGGIEVIAAGAGLGTLGVLAQVALTPLMPK
jgi:hypothetical protein